MSTPSKAESNIEWCKPCTGVGWCMKDDVPHECMCGYLRRIQAGMPPHLKRATVKKEHVRLSVVNQTKDNLFLIAHWSDVRAILKILLMTSNRFIRDTNDLDLKEVYVGSLSKKQRSVDYEGVIYNSLADFVIPPDLLVVRLNFISNSNKAASGVLEDSIKLRVDYGKPVWLVSDPTDPFSTTSISYSKRVADLIAREFTRVLVPKINETDSETTNAFFATPDLGRPDEDTRPPRVVPSTEIKKESKRVIQSASDDDDGIDSALSSYGSGINKSKKFRGRD